MATESGLPDSDEDRPIGLAETRAVIEQAKGILMATYRCGPDDASDMLRLASQASGVKVHLLAAQLVELARRGQAITAPGAARPRCLPLPQLRDLTAGVTADSAVRRASRTVRAPATRDGPRSRTPVVGLPGPRNRCQRRSAR